MLRAAAQRELSPSSCRLWTRIAALQHKLEQQRRLLQQQRRQHKQAVHAHDQAAADKWRAAAQKLQQEGALHTGQIKQLNGLVAELNGKLQEQRVRAGALEQQVLEQRTECASLTDRVAGLQKALSAAVADAERAHSSMGQELQQVRSRRRR